MSCGDPTGNMTLQNQIYDTETKPDTFDYNIQFRVRCRVGAKWSDNAIKQPMSCLADGTWTSISAFCAGKFVLKVLLFGKI